MLDAIGVTVVRGKRRLLDKVSLSVRPGELLVLMGENGAGKSTLLKVLSGDLKPDTGAVCLDGRPLRSWKAQDLARRRSVLPQETAVTFPFTALEVAVLGRSPWCSGYPGKRDYDRARAALRRVDAPHLESRLFPTLSGGERARVQLARVLCQIEGPAREGPRFVLLDEPIAALDIAHQHLALSVVRSFAREWGAGVVAVLHDLNLSAQYADEVVLLKAGRIFARGKPDDVLTPEAVLGCFATEMVRIQHPTRPHPVLVAL